MLIRECKFISIHSLLHRKVQLKSSALRCNLFTLGKLPLVNIVYYAICNIELIWILWRMGKLWFFFRPGIKPILLGLSVRGHRRTECYRVEACNLWLCWKWHYSLFLMNRGQPWNILVKIGQSMRRNQIGNMSIANMKDNVSFWMSAIQHT
jgi:hypothetical protein